MRNSLKPVTTGDTSPGRKKIVRFADSLGLDLAQIRHIQDDDQQSNPIVGYSPTLWSRRRLTSFGFSHERSLLRQFVLPSASLIDRLTSQSMVRLESLSITDFSIIGTIRVANLAFEKKVNISDYITYNFGFSKLGRDASIFIQNKRDIQANNIQLSFRDPIMFFQVYHLI